MYKRQIVDSTTLEEIYNKEVLVYACVAVGYIILCHIILDNNSPDGVMVFAGALPIAGYILCVYVLPISEGAAILNTILCIVGEIIASFAFIRE